MANTTATFSKKPNWLKVKLPQGENYQLIKKRRKTLGLATVCEEARCPNIGECWQTKTATFMIMGDTCTRGCRFCSVKTHRTPPPLDPQEPEKLSVTLKELSLQYIVLTTVDRDDLLDQGAKHIRTCIEVIQSKNPTLLIEILIPDFRGEFHLVQEVILAKPAVIAHNVETVKRLTRTVRDPRAGYQQSLDVLENIKSTSSNIYTKSSLMVGFGETKQEIINTMKDIKSVGVDFLTIGQYLQPHEFKLPVTEFVHPEQFKYYEEEGLKMGFEYVASAPLVRSSYKAAEHFIQQKIRKENKVS